LKGFDMKIKQTVDTKYDNLYIGWNNLQFTDIAGNEVKIDVTDNQILEIAEIINTKRDSILEERAEKEIEVE